eukprot:403330667
MSKIKNKFRVSRANNQSGFLNNLQNQNPKVSSTMLNHQSLSNFHNNINNNGNVYSTSTSQYFNNQQQNKPKIKFSQQNIQKLQKGDVGFNIDLEGLFQTSDDENVVVIEGNDSSRQLQKLVNNEDIDDQSRSNLQNQQNYSNPGILQQRNITQNPTDQNNNNYASRVNLKRYGINQSSLSALDTVNPNNYRITKQKMGKEIQVRIKEFVPILLKRNIAAEYVQNTGLSPQREDQSQSNHNRSDSIQGLNQQQIVQRYLKNNGYPRKNQRLLSEISRNYETKQSHSTNQIKLFQRGNSEYNRQNHQSLEGLPLNPNTQSSIDKLEINPSNERQLKNLKYANDILTLNMHEGQEIKAQNLKNTKTDANNLNKNRESHKRLIRELQEKILAAKQLQDYSLRGTAGVDKILNHQGSSSVIGLDPSTIYGRVEKELENKQSQNIQRQLSKRYRLNMKNLKKQIMAAQQANANKIDDQSMIQMISFVTNYPKRHLNQYFSQQQTDTNYQNSPNKPINKDNNTSVYQNLSNNEFHSRSLSFALDDGTGSLLGASDSMSILNRSDREKLEQIMNNYKSPPEFNNSLLQSIIESEKKQAQQSMEKLKISLAEDENKSIRKLQDNMKQSNGLMIQGGRFKNTQKDNYQTMYHQNNEYQNIEPNNNYFQTVYQQNNENEEQKLQSQQNNSQFVVQHSIVLGGSLSKSLQSIDIRLKPSAASNIEKIRLSHYNENNNNQQEQILQQDYQSRQNQQNLSKYLKKNANIQQLSTITRNHKFYEDQLTQPQPFASAQKVVTRNKFHYYDYGQQMQHNQQHYKTLSKSFDIFNATNHGQMTSQNQNLKNSNYHHASQTIYIAQQQQDLPENIQSVDTNQQHYSNQKGAVPLPKVRQIRQNAQMQQIKLLKQRDSQINSSLLNSTLQYTNSSLYNFEVTPQPRSQANSFKKPRLLHQSIQNLNMSKKQQPNNFTQNQTKQLYQELKPKSKLQNFSYLDDALIEEDIIQASQQIFHGSGLKNIDSNIRATNIPEQNNEKYQGSQQKVPETMPSMIKITIQKNSNRQQENSNKNQNQVRNSSIQHLDSHRSSKVNEVSDETPIERVLLKKELNDMFKQNFDNIERNNYDKFITISHQQAAASQTIYNNHSGNKNHQSQLSSYSQKKRNRSRNLSNSVIYMNENNRNNKYDDDHEQVTHLDLQLRKSNKTQNKDNNQAAHFTGW